ncbi:MAG: aldo/keto reductase [Chloroflexi bacterium]|nr:MAG: aldo/keto reductase [Chloroflexota bacterium]
METINFGSAGLKVSRLALGLGLRGQADANAAQRMIEHAIDQGINLIDCANVYAPLDNHRNSGQSELILGRAIAGKRDQIVITSKVASRVGPGPNDAGLSRGHILREIDRSLQRLGTDYLDVYLVHVFDPSTPLEETLRALDDVVRAGKVRYIGCCNFAAWQVCQAQWTAERIHGTPLMAVQNQYSLLERGPERELFGVVRALGLGMMAYSPLAIGLLSGLYTPGQPAPEGTFWHQRGAERYERLMGGQVGRVVTTVVEIAQELGKTPAQVALAWVLSHPEVTCAITGGDTIAHLDDNLGAVGWSLDPELRARLDEVSKTRGLLDV